MSLFPSEIFRDWQFCPRCGSASLYREYKISKSTGEEVTTGGPLEWNCSLCFISFAVTPSRRYLEVVDLLREAPTQTSSSNPKKYLKPKREKQ